MKGSSAEVQAKILWDISVVCLSSPYIGLTGKHMKKKVHFIVMAGLMLSLRSYAGDDAYICKILEVQELSTSGKFINPKNPFSQLVGESFSIERATGKVIGHPFSNKSYRETRVIDHGSAENSYKHIAISHPPNIWITYVYVSEHEKRLEKSFWGTSDGNKIYSGLCK